MTQTDERERQTWTRRSPMSKQERLEETRRMRDALRGGTNERKQRA